MTTRTELINRCSGSFSVGRFQSRWPHVCTHVPRLSPHVQTSAVARIYSKLFKRCPLCLAPRRTTDSTGTNQQSRSKAGDLT